MSVYCAPNNIKIYFVRNSSGAIANLSRGIQFSGILKTEKITDIYIPTQSFVQQFLLFFSDHVKQLP